MSVKFQMTIPDGLAARLKREAARNPFASITNLVDSEETDLSTRVDEILYG